MTILLDHVFLAVSPGGPEVGLLEAAGFAEGPPNVHPGQGTACRRFFFANGYLEFLWLENREEACSVSIAPTGLGQRLGDTPGASRIGLGFRPAAERPAPPVATWPYRPPYLPWGVAIHMAVNSDRIEEPLLFFLPPGPTPTTPAPEHPNGAQSITSITVVLPPGLRPSRELGWVAESGLVRVQRGEGEALGVELDGGARGERLSLEGPSALHLSW